MHSTVVVCRASTCRCMLLFGRGYIPTSPFTILEPQDQGIGEFYVVQKRRATDFEAPKL